MLYYSVCSDHFEHSQMYKGQNLRLKPGAYPTIFPQNNQNLMIENVELGGEESIPVSTDVATIHFTTPQSVDSSN